VVLVPVHTFRKEKRRRDPGEFYGLESCFFLCTFMQAGARSHGALSISPLGAVDRQKLFPGGGGDDFSSLPSYSVLRSGRRREAMQSAGSASLLI